MHDIAWQTRLAPYKRGVAWRGPFDRIDVTVDLGRGTRDSSTM